MLSRIFWVGIAGLALVAGIALQGGGSMFGWGDHRRVAEHRIDASVDRAIDRSVDQAVDRSLDGMQVVGPNGREIPVSPEAKRALIAAVGRLVKAEAELATLRIGDRSREEIDAAAAARDHARADVDRMKEQIKNRELAANVERDVRDQVRDDIRDTVREAVRN
jgi:hypothetical protein